MREGGGWWLALHKTNRCEVFAQSLHLLNMSQEREREKSYEKERVIRENTAAKAACPGRLSTGCQVKYSLICVPAV